MLLFRFEFTNIVRESGGAVQKTVFQSPNIFRVISDQLHFQVERAY